MSVPRNPRLLIVVAGEWVRIFSDSRLFIREVCAPAMPPKYDDEIERWIESETPRSHRDLLLPGRMVWQEVIRPAPPSEFERRLFDRQLLRSIEAAGRIARGEEGRP